MAHMHEIKKAPPGSKVRSRRWRIGMSDHQGWHDFEVVMVIGRDGPEELVRLVNVPEQMRRVLFKGAELDLRLAGKPA